MKEIANSGKYIEKWVGKCTPPDYVCKCITEGDLPTVPGASRDFYSFKAICLKACGNLIGYVDFYHGYPDSDTLWVSILLIDPTYQRQGYAQELVAGITYNARKLGYAALGIGVQLKNWPALRFWTNQGFDRIIKIVGDSEHSDNTFATISLRKMLR